MVFMVVVDVMVFMVVVDVLVFMVMVFMVVVDIMVFMVVVSKFFRKTYTTGKYMENFPGNLRKPEVVFTAYHIVWKVSGNFGNFMGILINFLIA